MQVKRGAKGEPWSGVRNHTAKLNMKKMKKGDRAFFYHTGDEKQIVGIVEVIREHYPDPTDEKGIFGLGRRQGGRAVAEAGDACRRQGRAEAQGHERWRASRACRCSR